MKTIFFLTLILVSAMTLAARNNSSNLPREWGKTFFISLAHTGSMSGGSSHITFTYDSCTYEITSLHDKPVKKSVLLSAKDRETILAKLREFKIEKVTHAMRIATQNDGWSTLLCLGSHCIEGGSDNRMDDKERGIFQDACYYLEEFAMKMK